MSAALSSWSRSRSGTRVCQFSRVAAAAPSASPAAHRSTIRSCWATEARPLSEENRSRSTRRSTGVNWSRTVRAAALAAAVTGTPWKASSAATAAGTSFSRRARAKRALASRMASSSAAERRGTAWRTTSSCRAAVTDWASRAARTSSGLTSVCRPGVVRTSPACSSRASASRTGVRLTPSQATRAASCSRSPGARVPSTMASRMARYASSRRRDLLTSPRLSGTGMQYIARRRRRDVKRRGGIRGAPTAQGPGLLGLPQPLKEQPDQAARVVAGVVVGPGAQVADAAHQLVRPRAGPDLMRRRRRRRGAGRRRGPGGRGSRRAGLRSRRCRRASRRRGRAW